MAKYSKAIAAFISAGAALLVSFGLVEPSLTNILDEQAAGMIAGALVAIGATLGVFISPKNEG